MLPVASRSVSRDIDREEGQRAGGSDGRGDGCGSETPSFPSARREPRWEQPPLPLPIRHKEQLERLNDRPSNAQVERGDNPSNRVSGSGYHDRRNVDEGPKPSSVDDTFGSMAPCWRLLERAQGYMEKVRIFYCTLTVSYCQSIGSSSVLSVTLWNALQTCLLCLTVDTVTFCMS